ncbi:hypothetical protein Ae201684P_020284 [Aphanomyces euteiches]|uniref:ARS-binding protein 1 N-terminal domain-containing protein n=1 Tax=Aphanomyces euteiches TaxID=100861 RepID=A0A6G0WFJ2_9STRA|nr:hypothetical protein Ae201684_015505 [Aphanomyces euteiches]KAH9084021.1 hypothetical protein Ae201684P_020284 [Aphanomyces euteiches]KAH9141757.1 hypothetical protein AeRB84_014100 [Aphanomyces euteiches]
MTPRTHLSVSQKKQIKDYHIGNPKLTQDDLCRWALTKFGCRVGRSTMSKILNEDLPQTLTPDAKRLQKGRFPDVEEELYKFVLANQTKVPLTDFVLYKKANELLAYTLFLVPVHVLPQDFHQIKSPFHTFSNRAHIPVELSRL